MFGNIMAARHAICKQREDTGSMHCNAITTGPSTKLLLFKGHELFTEYKFHIKSKPPFWQN